jgi:hypothetical protein
MGCAITPRARARVWVIDECGDEFGIGLQAETRAEVHDKAKDYYPECRCIQMESSDDIVKRRARERAFAADGGDYDDEGRPFYHR